MVTQRHVGILPAALEATSGPLGRSAAHFGSSGDSVDPVELHGVRLISSAARACKTKHSGVVTQRHAGILPTALEATSGPLERSAARFGSSGDNVDLVRLHWGPLDLKCRQAL